MAISRPLLLTLIGAVLAVATFYAVTSARDSASTNESAAVQPAAETPAAPAAKPAAAKLGADEAMTAALDTSQVKSARFDGSLAVTGKEGGSIEVDGAFQLGGPQDMPKFDLSLKVTGDGQDVDAGFVSTGDKGYVLTDGKAYAFPEDAWSQVVQARTAQAGNPAPTPTAILGPDAAKWVRDVKDEGTETVDGVETRHVTATIDASAAVRDMAKLAGGALPAGAAASVKDARIEVWVGTGDRIVRRVSGELAIGDEQVELDFSLSEVNDPQTIEAPANVETSAPPAFAAGFVQGFSAATGVPADAIELPRNNFPQRLDRAVADHKPAVLFFRQARGLDDAATADAVRTLDRRTNVLVLSDDVRNADRYGKLVEDLGVTQAPSIVIVDRDGKARLIEGFVDSQSLLQDVADIR